MTRVDFKTFFVFFTEDEVDKASLENMPANLYESVCVPDLGEFLGYQGANNSVTTAVTTTTNPPELKSPATPASSITSTSSISRSGPPQSSIQSPINPPQIPRPYHNDSKYL